MRCFYQLKLNYQNITNQVDILQTYSEIQSNIHLFSNYFSFEFEKTINSMKFDEPKSI